MDNRTRIDKLNPLAVAVHTNGSQQDFTIDTSGDEDFLKKENFNWDDIEKFRSEVAEATMGFVTEIAGLVSNPAIVNNLGELKDHFNQTAGQFFEDMEDFSKKVSKIRKRHESLSGPVTSVDDYTTYNRLALEYNTLFEELTTLVAPTMGELIVTAASVIPASVPVVQPVGDVVDGAVEPDSAQAQEEKDV